MTVAPSVPCLSISFIYECCTPAAKVVSKLNQMLKEVVYLMCTIHCQGMFIHNTGWHCNIICNHNLLSFIMILHHSIYFLLIFLVSNSCLHFYYVWHLSCICCSSFHGDISTFAPMILIYISYLILISIWWIPVTFS